MHRLAGEPGPDGAGDRGGAPPDGLHGARLWNKRFSTCGSAGLEDRPRAGRRPTYTAAEQVAKVVATAPTGPKTLGLPFACWTLDRLAAYRNEGEAAARKVRKLPSTVDHGRKVGGRGRCRHGQPVRTR
ncbi:helix-turn-helix domain-containing protein [Benzoatithermus flavus]|uniref:helix-turn-helix domain-containing protein n=1 Tax=Benzoatithermus flavus TaxID=3108223 RepID=UPI003AB012B6